METSNISMPEKLPLGENGDIVAGGGLPDVVKKINEIVTYLRTIPASSPNPCACPRIDPDS